MPMPCPKCGGEISEKLSRREYKDAVFLIKAPRRCAECGCVFLPACGMLLCASVIGLGIAVAGMSIGCHIVPAISSAFGGGSLLGAAVDLVMGILCVSFSVSMILVGARSWKRGNQIGDEFP